MRGYTAQQTRVVQLPVADIDPSPFQTRTEFKPAEIKKLAVSILQNGLLQPISVRPAPGGRYQLIAGERRLRACKMAGLACIPALVYHFEDDKTAALSLLENLQREQLNPFEQARALRALLDLWDCTQEAGARRLGMAQPTLANKLRLLTLSPEQQQLCLEAGLTERHARAVLRLPTAELRTKALRTAAAKGYNVQQTEALVARALQKKPAPRPRPKVMVRDVRLFVNTIERAVKLMTGSGIPATSEKLEGEGYIQYTVRIPTAPAAAPGADRGPARGQPVPRAAAEQPAAPANGGPAANPAGRAVTMAEPAVAAMARPTRSGSAEAARLLAALARWQPRPLLPG